MNNKIVLLFIAIIVTISYFYFSSHQNFDEQTKRENTTKGFPLVENKHKLNSNNTPLVEKINPWQEIEKTTPIMKYFDELVEAANNGDPDAQYHIGIAHRYCLNVPETEEQLNKNLLPPNTKEIKYLGNNEIVNETFVQAFDWCKGFPRNQFTGKWKEMLLQAARGGNSYAKIEFSTVALSLIDPMDYVSKTEEISEIKKEAINHLIDSRTLGNKNALVALGGAYEDGIFIEKDLIEAFANYYAFAYYSSSPNPYKFMERFENVLSNEELKLATLKGEKYEACCT